MMKKIIIPSITSLVIYAVLCTVTWHLCENRSQMGWALGAALGVAGSAGPCSDVSEDVCRIWWTPGMRARVLPCLSGDFH